MNNNNPISDIKGLTLESVGSISAGESITFTAPGDTVRVTWDDGGGDEY